MNFSEILTPPYIYQFFMLYDKNDLSVLVLILFNYFVHHSY